MKHIWVIVNSDGEACHCRFVYTRKQAAEILRGYKRGDGYRIAKAVITNKRAPRRSHAEPRTD